MPIIEPIAPDEPLSQGDILQRIRLFATEDILETDGGKATEPPRKMCLVLSRPCAAKHKASVVVAAIGQYPDKLPKDVKEKVQDFEDVRFFLTNMRDGVDEPDLFYLGQVPGKAPRYCARMDALFSIKVPVEPSERKTFLDRHRIAKLNIEFCRDLHLRLFRAFASLGFDDHSWFSNKDLEWLATTGSTDLKSVASEIEAAKAEQARERAAGKTPSEKDVGRLEGKREKLEEMIQPYLSERESRDLS